MFDPLHVERMYDMGNKDGFGLMYVDQIDGVDRVKFEKSMSSWQGLEDLYKKHQHRALAMHIRKATFGEKNLDNCHPYCILSMDEGHKIDLYMMHNGTIRDVQVDKKMSDSYNFATKFLRGLLAKRPHLLQDKDFQYFLCGIIGPNKLVFLDNKKRITIINEEMGSIHSTGVWISTKDEVKPYDYRIKKSTPVILESNHGTSTSTAGAWKFSRDGDWKADGDNRLHFMVNLNKKKVETVKPQVEEADVTTAGTEDEVEATVNGILSAGEDVDEEGLAELMSKIPNMPFHDVYQFLLAYHAEAISMIAKNTDDKDKKTIAYMVMTRPWEATNLLVKAAENFNGNLKSAAYN